jgi:hypothetical protein
MKRKSKQWGREWTESPAGKEFREKYVGGRWKKNITTKHGLTAKKGRGGVMYSKKGKHGESVPIPISEWPKMEKERKTREAAAKRVREEWQERGQKMSPRDAAKYHAAKEKERQRRQRRRGRVGRAAGAVRDFARRFDIPATPAPKYKEGWRAKAKRTQSKEMLRAAGLSADSGGQFSNADLQARIDSRAKAGLETWGHSSAAKKKGVKAGTPQTRDAIEAARKEKLTPEQRKGEDIASRKKWIAIQKKTVNKNIRAFKAARDAGDEAKARKLMATIEAGRESVERSQRFLQEAQGGS